MTAGRYFRRLRNSRAPHAGPSKPAARAPWGGLVRNTARRGQPRARSHVPISRPIQPSRTGGQSKPARSGTVARGCMAGAASQTSGSFQHPCLRSSQVASVRPLAPRHGRHGCVMAPAWFAPLLAAPSPTARAATEKKKGRSSFHEDNGLPFFPGAIAQHLFHGDGRGDKLAPWGEGTGTGLAVSFPWRGSAQRPREPFLNLPWAASGGGLVPGPRVAAREGAPFLSSLPGRAAVRGLSSVGGTNPRGDKVISPGLLFRARGGGLSLHRVDRKWRKSTVGAMKCNKSRTPGPGPVTARPE